MEIINAFWEKRNLGVDAVSFQIGRNDTAEEVIPQIEFDQREYQSAIVDSTKTDIVLELQNHGFRFIECSLELSASSDEAIIPDNLKRFQKSMGYRPASHDEIKLIKSIIESGDIFKTDKISLDPYFGTKKAGIRYSFWIDDLIKAGKTLSVITFDDEPIAFDVAGYSEGVVEHYLGGMLPGKKGKMLGATISVPSILYWKQHGAKQFKTVVSSNNHPILKVHQSFGFKIVNCKYILIRHIENNK